MNYVKLFQSLLDSTLWSEPHATRLVWITLLLKADKEGCVYTSVPGLVRAANVTRDEVDTAIAAFLQPDPDSASIAFDGRRIESIERGYKILNYETYNELKSAEDVREKARVRQAKKRERDREKIARGEWLPPETAEGEPTKTKPGVPCTTCEKGAHVNQNFVDLCGERADAEAA